MDFVYNVTSLNELSESVEFEWSIGHYPTMPQLVSREIALTLSGGLRFQIIVSKWVYPPDHEFYNNRVSIKVGLQKTEADNYDVHALLLFEIDNYMGETYLKESMEKQFSQMKEEQCLSKSFEMPTRSNDSVRGRYKDLCFDHGMFTIIGTVFFQCSRERKVSELLRKNNGQLQSDLKDLLQSKMHADVAFHIGDTVIQAHKNIMCSRSAVFKKMFEQDMKEKELNSVKITDIEKSVFEVFLLFLYTGTLQEKNLDFVMPLYSVADKYAVETLLNTCSHILIHSISDATVVPILSLADMHNDATLKVAAVDFICEHFAGVGVTVSWDALLSSDPRLASFVLKQVSTTAVKNAAK